MDREDNLLATNLAEYGANIWKEMVILEEPVGRVEEIWHYDMGLGNYGPRFRAALQGEVNPAVMADEVVNPPPIVVNRENNNGGPMELKKMQGGIELRAAAAGLNEGDHMENGFVGPVPNEVVIGLATVPLQAEGGDKTKLQIEFCDGLNQVGEF